jgi:hypothetical protein
MTDNERSRQIRQRVEALRALDDAERALDIAAGMISRAADCHGRACVTVFRFADARTLGKLLQLTEREQNAARKRRIAAEAELMRYTKEG